MHERVAIHGGGLAAWACAAALVRRGMEVHVIGAEEARSGGPALVLNDVCLSLLRGLFPSLRVDQLGYPLKARRVCWANDGLKRINTPAIAIRSETLLDALTLEGVERYEEAPTNLDYAWQIYAGRFDEAARRRIRAGSRVILASAVALSDKSMDTCSIESVTGGWLFLTSLSPGKGVVQAMVPRSRDPVGQLDEMLRQSELIGPELQVLGDPEIMLAAPYVVLPVAGDGWLAIGHGAAGLDPIGGEGSPFSLRTALLAAAVIGAVSGGRMSAREGQDHYEHRLTLTVLAHLNGCAKFYSEAFGIDREWLAEIRSTARSHREIVDSVQPPAPQCLRWQLAGDRLQRR